MRRYSAPYLSVWLPFRLEIETLPVWVRCVARVGPLLPTMFVPPYPVMLTCGNVLNVHRAHEA